VIGGTNVSVGKDSKLSNYKTKKEGMRTAMSPTLGRGGIILLSPEMLGINNDATKSE
jgi:hypothetical protein